MCTCTKTSEIAKNALPGILGLLCAEQNVGNLKKCTVSISETLVRRTTRQKFQKMHVQEFWDSCAQNKTSEISKNRFYLYKSTFRHSGTPVRRIKCRKYQTNALQKLWDSCAQNKTLYFANTRLSRKVWDSCAQNRTSEISNNALSEFLGLRFAGQNVGNIENALSFLVWDSGSQNNASES